VIVVQDGPEIYLLRCECKSFAFSFQSVLTTVLSWSIRHLPCLGQANHHIAHEPENGATDVPSPTSDEPGISLTKANLTIETEYVHMLLELDTIDWVYNFLSSFANWTLLAGYLVIPGTFTTLQKSDT
jgi:hypothetical protein